MDAIPGEWLTKRALRPGMVFLIELQLKYSSGGWPYFGWVDWGRKGGGGSGGLDWVEWVEWVKENPKR